MTRVLITRPSPEAERWVQQLQDEQVDALALPLLRIGAVRDPELTQTLRAVRQRASQGAYRALMFVSGHAAAHFLRMDDAAAPVQVPPTTRCWSPGPGTARMLEEAGVAPSRIDGPALDAEQFDSESLWEVVARQIRPGDRVLIVRGATSAHARQGNGRDWLAAQISAAGGIPEFVAAYERLGAPLGNTGKDLAERAATDGTLWFFSSSEAVQHLLTELPHVTWDKARALVTHPRIAQAVRAAGFGNTTECRPTLHEVAASIKSLL